MSKQPDEAEMAALQGAGTPDKPVRKLMSGVSDWMGRRGASRATVPVSGRTGEELVPEPARSQPVELSLLEAAGLNPVHLDDAPGAVAQANFDRLVEALGWDYDDYLRAYPDLARVDSQGGAIKLLAHFLKNGVNERRKFSDRVRYAGAYFIDHSVLGGDYLLCVGWSEVPLSQPRVALGYGEAYAAVPAAHINVFRDDVSQHLGTKARQKSHGFLLICKASAALAKKSIRLLIRDDRQLLTATIAPQPVALNEWVPSVFRMVQERLSYEEMVRAFGEHYPFLELLHKAMAPVYADSPGEFRYAGKASGSVELSVCAVLLGKAALLKPFMASLLQHRPADARWELLLLANAGLEVENIRSAAEWCSEVYGVDVTVLAAESNLGFGGGMNLLVSKARGRLAMLTNIDVRYTRIDTRQLAAEALEQGAVVAAYQFNPSGSLQHEGLTHDRRVALVNGEPLELLDTRLLGRNTLPGKLERKEVEYFGAACVVGEAAALRELGPFSTLYFYAYHEDCDFARRARQSGRACVLSPALQIVHYESSGAANISMPVRALNAANLVTFMRAGATERIS